jgi:hypothetical protein
MDESFQELENELKALQPRRPSVLLRAKIERELAQPAAAAEHVRPRYTSATSLRSWKWAGWRVAGGLAAALAISFLVWETQRVERGVDPVNEAASTDRSGTGIDPNGVEVAATENVYRPVKAANVLYDVQDEGAVMLENDIAARKVRARYVDTYTFKNPATNASLRLSVPRDEVRILPASFH